MAKKELMMDNFQGPNNEINNGTTNRNILIKCNQGNEPISKVQGIKQIMEVALVGPNGM